MRKLFIILLLFENICAFVPLPHANTTQNKGLNVGMGFGTISNSKCKTLWTWTAQSTFFYNSHFSGGPSIRFMGGNLDSANNLVYQRYSIQAAFTEDRGKFAFTIGPIFSFESTSLSELGNEFSHIGEDGGNGQEITNRSADTECSELFEDIGSSIGYRAGIGYLITPVWGVTLGHSLDLTFKGAYIVLFNGSLAFNLREYSQRLLKNTQNLYLSLEYQNSFDKSSKTLHVIILGFVIGF